MLRMRRRAPGQASNMHTAPHGATLGTAAKSGRLAFKQGLLHLQSARLDAVGGVDCGGLPWLPATPGSIQPGISLARRDEMVHCWQPASSASSCRSVPAPVVHSGAQCFPCRLCQSRPQRRRCGNCCRLLSWMAQPRVWQVLNKVRTCDSASTSRSAVQRSYFCHRECKPRRTQGQKLPIRM